MWGLATVADVTQAVFTITGFPVADRGTEATIGAAQRYQAPQISDKDVVLGDAQIQKFLQSETFDRLLKDENARKLLSNEVMRNAPRDPALIRRLGLEAMRSPPPSATGPSPRQSRPNCWTTASGSGRQLR
jgi:hypothetical protein